MSGDRAFLDEKEQSSDRQMHPRETNRGVVVVRFDSLRRPPTTVSERVEGRNDDSDNVSMIAEQRRLERRAAASSIGKIELSTAVRAADSS